MGALAGDLPPVDHPERLRERLSAAVEETEQLPRPAWEGERTPPVPPAVPDRPAPVHRFEPPASGAHRAPIPVDAVDPRDRKSTRLNSSHANISYAVFCLKKKKYKQHNPS